MSFLAAVARRFALTVPKPLPAPRLDPLESPLLAPREVWVRPITDISRSFDTWRPDGSPGGESEQPTEESVRILSLSTEAFPPGSGVRGDLLHTVVCWQLMSRRQARRPTKTRSSISGSGRKPWPQKGTGRARAGDMRAPQMRGGYIPHGVHVNQNREGWGWYALPRGVRRAGLRAALTAKHAQGELHVASDIDGPVVPRDEAGPGLAGALSCGRTSAASSILSDWPCRSVLFIGAGEAVRRATGNLANVSCLPVEGINVYDILRHDSVVLSETALRAVEEKLSSIRD